MKNKLLALILIITLSLSLTFAFCSCKSKEQIPEETLTEDQLLQNDTELGDLELPTYASPNEQQFETENDSTPILNNSPNNTETENSTTIPPQEENKVESLKFTSYGNGTCGVNSIGNCTSSCIVIPERSPYGDVVTTIEEKAFYGNTSIKAIEIPSTVTSIEEKAFGACSSLVYISVSKSNKAFTDINGILFSCDLTKIYAFPAACGVVNIDIPTSVTVISAMAFYGCDSLEKVFYGGTLEDWGKISIGDMNYGLFTAALCYNTKSE